MLSFTVKRCFSSVVATYCQYPVSSLNGFNSLWQQDVTQSCSGQVTENTNGYSVRINYALHKLIKDLQFFIMV